MAYLHCHSCDWSQDDFWSMDGYNPFREDTIKDLKENLFKEYLYYDEWWIKELGIPYTRTKKGAKVKSQHVVGKILENKAKSIFNMDVKTNEEWVKVRLKWKCPECGSDDWDID